MCAGPKPGQTRRRHDSIGLSVANQYWAGAHGYVPPSHRNLMMPSTHATAQRAGRASFALPLTREWKRWSLSCLCGGVEVPVGGMWHATMAQIAMPLYALQAGSHWLVQARHHASYHVSWAGYWCTSKAPSWQRGKDHEPPAHVWYGRDGELGGGQPFILATFRLRYRTSI